MPDMHTDPEQQKRIQSIDYFRSLAIIAVILLHTNPFEYAAVDLMNGRRTSLLLGIMGMFIRYITSAAIPFFFVVAGFFLHKKIMASTGPGKVLVRYLRRLSVVFLFWVFIFYAVPASDMFDFIRQNGYFSYFCDVQYYWEHPIEVLLTGGANHLWFIPALMISASFVALLATRNKEYFLLPMVVSFFCVQFIAKTNNYSSLGASVNIVLAAAAKEMGNAPLTSYLLAPLFVYIGWCLAKRTVFDIRQAIVIICAGIVISVLEIAYITVQYGTLPDELFGIVPFATGIVMLGLAVPGFGEGRTLTKYGRLTLGIYGIHYLFIVHLRPFTTWFQHPFIDIIYPVTVYALSLGFALVFSKNRWLRHLVA